MDNRTVVVHKPGYIVRIVTQPLNERSMPEERQRVLNLIREAPGINPSALQRRLKIRLRGGLEGHIVALIKMGLVTQWRSPTPHTLQPGDVTAEFYPVKERVWLRRDNDESLE